MSERKKSWQVLTMNTLAFTVCFAVWMMNGVLITFLVNNGVFEWDKAQMGWLIGIPVLTGSLVRLPLGVLTDKFGGRAVFSLLMLLSAVPTYLLSYASSYSEFLLASLGFGIIGGSFAVGIAYTSVWFPKHQQGTALGIFGVGNAGAAVTSVFAPILLKYLTDNGANLEGWRQMPQIYAVALVVMTLIYYQLTFSRKVASKHISNFMQRLEPLKYVRVYRFGLYYFLVCGGFVGLSQWLIPYYVNAYGMTVVMAGTMAAIFSFPSGVIRALGGWLSDKLGARLVMYWVFGSILACCALLMVPKMDIYTPGKGIQTLTDGEVISVSEKEIVVKGKVKEHRFQLKQKVDQDFSREDSFVVFPKKNFWQEPVVKVGDVVERKQLIAKGVTHIYFQANVWIFTALVFIVGIMMGIGKAAVYKHIPDYYPRDVGVVGGIVGVIGGLGGFVCPIIFGYLLQATGIWTTCWMFFTVLTLGCLLWMHSVIKKMMYEQVPELMRKIE